MTLDSIRKRIEALASIKPPRRLTREESAERIVHLLEGHRERFEDFANTGRPWPWQRKTEQSEEEKRADADTARCTEALFEEIRESRADLYERYRAICEWGISVAAKRVILSN